MSSTSLVYSNRKVCAGWDGQSRRFRLFTTIDPFAYERLIHVNDVLKKRTKKKIFYFMISFQYVKMLVTTIQYVTFFYEEAKIRAIFF